MQDIKNELLDCLQNSDLLGAALILGKVESRGFEEDPYTEKVMHLADRIWKKIRTQKNDMVFIAECINQVLFEEEKIIGKSEQFKKLIDDPKQYYLHRLLDKKQGGPITLAILYFILWEQLGLSCDCIAFPGHYFLRVKDVSGEFYINPFEQGKCFSEIEFRRKLKSVMQKSQASSTNLYEMVTPYQMISRMIQRLKQIYILKNDVLHAVRAVELLTALFPESPELTRDRGILYCEMEYFSKAVEDLRFYIKNRPEAEDIKEIRKLTTMLRGYRETMN